MIMSLNDLQEKRRPILQSARKDLQQISILIEIHHNPQLLNNVQVFPDPHPTLRQLGAQNLIVLVGRVQKLNSACAHTAHRPKNVVGGQRNVLHTGTAIIVDKLPDLAAFRSGRRLGDGHLDRFVVVAHDDRAQTRLAGVHLSFVDRPKAMELQVAFVPIGDALHFEIGLIADAVIDADQRMNGRQELDERVLGCDRLEAGQKKSRIGVALDERVSGVTVLKLDVVKPLIFFL